MRPDRAHPFARPFPLPAPASILFFRPIAPSAPSKVLRGTLRVGVTGAALMPVGCVVERHDTNISGVTTGCGDRTMKHRLDDEER